MLLVGSGTSRHAAAGAAGWFRRWGIRAHAGAATEIRGPLRERIGEGVLLAVTQSGGDRQCAPAAAAGRSGRHLPGRGDQRGRKRGGAARRAAPGSPVPGGSWRSPATKSFTAALLALRFLGLVWARSAGPSGDSEAISPRERCRAVPDLLQAAILRHPEVRRFVESVRVEGPWVFLGGGPMLPLADEGALKMMETAVVPAVSLAAGELAHGPRALLGPGTPVVLLSAGRAPSRGELRSLTAAREAGARVLWLRPARGADDKDCDGGAPDSAAFADALRIPCPGSVGLRPFSLAPILQLLACFAGLRLGRPVDRPSRASEGGA